jgi:hypothetical protein
MSLIAQNSFAVVIESKQNPAMSGACPTLENPAMSGGAFRILANLQEIFTE